MLGHLVGSRRRRHSRSDAIREPLSPCSAGEKDLSRTAAAVSYQQLYGVKPFATAAGLAAAALLRLTILIFSLSPSASFSLLLFSFLRLQRRGQFLVLLPRLHRSSRVR